MAKKDLKAKIKAAFNRRAYTIDDTLREIQTTLSSGDTIANRVERLNDSLRRHWGMPGRQYDDSQFEAKAYRPLVSTYGGVGLISWEELIATPKRRQ